MRQRKRVVMGAALIGMALLLGTRSADAQVSAEAGQQFLGKWTLALDPPQGGFGGGGGGGGGFGGGGGMGGGGGAPQPQVLDIVADGGQLKATLTGGMGPMANQPREMTSISLDNGTLVLGYTMSFGGNSMPASIRLTPDGSTMKVETVFNDQFRRTGTATKE